MSDVKAGIWSALGAIAGGAAGAFAGRYAAQMRPRGYGARRSSQELEDAMVVGGSAGAVLGAFFGGTIGADEPPKQLASK